MKHASGSRELLPVNGRVVVRAHVPLVIRAIHGVIFSEPHARAEELLQV